MTVYFKELTHKHTFICDELPSQGAEWAKSQGLTHIMQTQVPALFASQDTSLYRS